MPGTQGLQPATPLFTGLLAYDQFTVFFRLFLITFLILVTALTSGLANRKSLYTGLTVVAIGLAVYYPFNLISDYLTLWSVIGLAVLTVAVLPQTRQFTAGAEEFRLRHGLHGRVPILWQALQANRLRHKAK